MHMQYLPTEEGADIAAALPLVAPQFAPATQTIRHSLQPSPNIAVRRRGSEIEAKFEKPFLL